MEDIGRQMGPANQSGFCHHKSILHGAFQFPNIAGPGIGHEVLQDGPAHTGDGLGGFGSQAVDKMVDQQGDIPNTFIIVPYGINEKGGPGGF